MPAASTQGESLVIDEGYGLGQARAGRWQARTHDVPQNVRAQILEPRSYGGPPERDRDRMRQRLVAARERDDVSVGEAAGGATLGQGGRMERHARGFARFGVFHDQTVRVETDVAPS